MHVSVMATRNSTTTATSTSSEDQQSGATLKLTLKKEKTRKIQWTEDTVDNEGKSFLDHPLQAMVTSKTEK